MLPLTEQEKKFLVISLVASLAAALIKHYIIVIFDPRS
jgi:hypothetical protein